MIVEQTHGLYSKLKVWVGMDSAGLYLHIAVGWSLHLIVCNCKCNCIYMTTITNSGTSVRAAVTDFIRHGLEVESRALI